MKTLQEHNDSFKAFSDYIYDNNPRQNGIACPKCGKEMWDSTPNRVLASIPPKYNVHCDCGYSGYRY